MKMAHINRILILAILFCGCANTEKKSNDTATATTDMKKSISYQNENEWKRDSLGCLGLRSLELAEKMIERNDLLGKSIQEFTNYFGKANKKIDKGKEILLIYYTETRCENGLIVQEADKCWVQFTFEKNKLLKIPKVFACE